MTEPTDPRFRRTPDTAAPARMAKLLARHSGWTARSRCAPPRPGAGFDQKGAGMIGNCADPLSRQRRIWANLPGTDAGRVDGRINRRHR